MAGPPQRQRQPPRKRRSSKSRWVEDKLNSEHGDDVEEFEEHWEDLISNEGFSEGLLARLSGIDETTNVPNLKLGTIIYNILLIKKIKRYIYRCRIFLVSIYIQYRLNVKALIMRS